MSIEEKADLILKFNEKIFENKNILNRYEIIANLSVGKTQFFLTSEKGRTLLEYSISANDEITLHLNLIKKIDELTTNIELLPECLKIFSLFNNMKYLIKEMFLNEFSFLGMYMYSEFLSNGWYLTINEDTDKLNFSFKVFNKFKKSTPIEYDSMAPLYIHMKDNQLYGSFFDFCAQNIYKKYSIDVADFNEVEKYETLINMVTI